MIFLFGHYKDWLKSELEQRVKDNPNYSAMAFARKLKLSPSHLSMILNGSRTLSEVKALEIAQFLDLSESEREYLLLMVKRQVLSKSGFDEMVEKKLQSLSRDQRRTGLNADSFQVIADWHFSALLELINTKGVSHDIITLAHKLGLEEHVVAKSIDVLTRSKLIKRVGRRFVRTDAGWIDIPSEAYSRALRHFHRQVLGLAIESLESQSTQVRTVTGATMSIDPSRLPQANLMIKQFTEELMRFLEGGEKKQVYQLSVQLFRLDKDLPNTEEKNHVTL